MRKQLVTAIAAAIIFTMVPTIPAAAEEVAATTSTDDTQTAVTEDTSSTSTDTAAAADTTAASTDTTSASTDTQPQKTTEKTATITIKKAYVPVNAKKLTSSYKAKLKKKRASVISVKKKSLSQSTAFEEKALIDISWNELKKYSRVKITKKDFDLMCRTVSAEAGDSASYKAKELTAEVIVNRAKSYKGSNPVSKAIHAKGQFAVTRNGAINRVTINGETVNACKDALIKASHPSTLLFFSAGRYFSWAKPYMAVDGSYFCLKK